jgi:hypothetical protein
MKYSFKQKIIYLPLPQGITLHWTLSEADPGHAAPPLEGAGLQQSLVRVRVPPSHDFVQADQLPQVPQLPSKIKAEMFFPKTLVQSHKLPSFTGS